VRFSKGRTWTEFRGFDPSSRAGSREYPTPKIISVGLEIDFKDMKKLNIYLY
jgi:hypothetical protein